MPCDGVCVMPPVTCACERGTVLCSAGPLGCVDLRRDPGNCGACGRTCGPEQLCAEGRCGCPTGRLPCGAACVDVLHDAMHCGACGRACGAGRACRWGRCVAACTEGRGACTVGAPDACNVDLTASAEHCGACFRACPPGFRCGPGGRCVCEGQARCAGLTPGTGPYPHAPTACGPERVRCAPGQHCATGACACLPDQTLCASGCAALARDASNCGACDVACRSGEDCAAGRCAARPAPRPLWPPSGAVLNTRRPAFRWLPSGGEVTARVELCRDRACTPPFATLPAVGATASPPADLAAGVGFWRVRSARADGTEATSTTWAFQLTARAGTGGGLVGHFVDVNGDGFADHVRREPIEVICVYPGAVGGLRGGTCHRYGSSRRVEERAQAAPALGDFDGDGFTDVAVREERPGAASVVVLRGGPAGLARPALYWDDGGPWPLDPSYDNNPGTFAVLRGVGDVNGDGYADLATFSPLGQGALALHGGAAGTRWMPWGVLAQPIRDVEGVAAYLDDVPTNVGDLTGDGRGDLLLDPLQPLAPRTLLVLPGEATGLAPELTWRLDGQSWPLGTVAGDFDGDGPCDLGVLFRGELTAYLGRSSGFPPAPAQHAMPGAQSAVGATSFDGARDLNGDGRSDVLVVEGRDSYTVLRAYLGRVGGFTRAEPTPAFQVAGAGPPVAWAGDVDRDGFDDVIVTDTSGALLLYRGGAGGLPENPSQQTPPAAVP